MEIRRCFAWRICKSIIISMYPSVFCKYEQFNHRNEKLIRKIPTKPNWFKALKRRLSMVFEWRAQKMNDICFFYFHLNYSMPNSRK